MAICLLSSSTSYFMRIQDARYKNKIKGKKKRNEIYVKTLWTFEWINLQENYVKGIEKVKNKESFFCIRRKKGTENERIR